MNERENPQCINGKKIKSNKQDIPYGPCSNCKTNGVERTCSLLIGDRDDVINMAAGYSSPKKYRRAMESSPQQVGVAIESFAVYF